MTSPTSEQRFANRMTEATRADSLSTGMMTEIFPSRGFDEEAALRDTLALLPSACVRVLFPDVGFRGISL
jgi:hypothetical protein